MDLHWTVNRSFAWFMNHPLTKSIKLISYNWLNWIDLYINSRMTDYWSNYHPSHCDTYKFLYIFVYILNYVIAILLVWKNDHERKTFVRLVFIKRKMICIVSAINNKYGRLKNYVKSIKINWYEKGKGRSNMRKGVICDNI